MSATHRVSLAAGQDVDFLRRQTVSQKPRWKRHASLDGGSAFRSRMGSLVSDAADYGPLSDDTDEKAYFLGETPPSSRRDSLFPARRATLLPVAASRRPSSFAGPTPTPREFLEALPKRWAFGMFMTMIGGAFVIVLACLAYASSRPAEAKLWGVKGFLESHGVALPYARVQCENPYHEYGRLNVDLNEPDLTRWLPYDPACQSPPLMSTLREHLSTNTSASAAFPTTRKSTSSDVPLPWLVHKTVLLFGDHIERFHSEDFCSLAGGVFTVIDAEHEYSPPPFKNGIDEKLVTVDEDKMTDEARPTVCYIEEYDFMVVSAFHFGLATRVEFEKGTLLNEDHFYPPVAVQNRLSSIVLPLLRSLDRTPSLIEFSSGFWDLRHFAALDQRAGLSSSTPLTVDRLEWYSNRLTDSLTKMSNAFPDTPLLWRALHHPPSEQSAPTTRVAALDQLSRKVISNLNRRAAGLPVLDHLVGDGTGSFEMLHRPSKAVEDRGSTHAPFLNRVKQRIGKVADQVLLPYHKEDVAPTLGAIRVDEWGALMVGQEHLAEALRTPALPGGYLWGDIMLFELRKAALHNSR